MPSRRRFLAAAAAGGAGLLAARSARAAGARIEVLLDEAIGPVAPELYGQFVEHLGGVVYDGIWAVSSLMASPASVAPASSVWVAP